MGPSSCVPLLTHPISRGCDLCLALAMVAMPATPRKLPDAAVAPDLFHRCPFVVAILLRPLSSALSLPVLCPARQRCVWMSPPPLRCCVLLLM